MNDKEIIKNLIKLVGSRCGNNDCELPATRKAKYKYNLVIVDHNKYCDNHVYDRDASEALGNEVDLVMGFKYIVEDNQPKLIFSCRSNGTFDVSVLAKAYGGGGHTNAAGFSRPVDFDDSNPYVTATRCVSNLKYL